MDSPQLSLLAFGAMPIYEYRCPDGHTFEVFQRMADPPSEVCEVCGKRPVEKVLYPVAVHYKGSGFYSTDYGKGSRKKDSAGSEGGSSDGGGSGSDGGSAKTGDAKTSSDNSSSGASSTPPPKTSTDS